MLGHTAHEHSCETQPGDACN
ncbi:protein of unknown function [Burkholderia multivorans]